MDLNKVLIIGNLTRDPESRFLQNGSQVCKIGLAANRRFTVNGEKREEVLFIDVEFWGKTAELASQWLKKGSQVLVEGRLKMDQYQSKEGEKRTRFLIVGESMQFGAKAQGGEQGQQKTEAAGGEEQHGATSQGTTDDLPF